MRACIARAPAVKGVVLFEGTPGGGSETAYRDFIAKGDAVEKADPKGFETRVAAMQMADPCLLHLHVRHHREPQGGAAHPR